MKLRLILLVAPLFFFACEPAVLKLSEQLKTADAVEITFSDGINVPVEIKITEGADLETVRNLLTEEESPAYKCGSDGSIKYWKNNSLLLNADFKLQEDCAHASFIEDGKVVFRKLNLENARLLEELKPIVKAQPLKALEGFLGLWTQKEGIDLVSFEEWKKVNDDFFQARSWTMFGDKQVYEENIELKVENDEVFYIPHVVENAGPVRFKMTSLVGNLVTFENPEHDFPQKITYEMRGDTMLFATISGIKDGKEGKKEFPLRKAN